MQEILDEPVLVEENELPPQNEIEEDMPLNATDKAWIHQEISDAAKQSPSGRVRRFIKEWSGTSAAVAILILAFTQWNAYTEFRVHTADRLDTIEKKLVAVGGSFASLQLEDLSKEPITPASARQVKAVIDTAKQNGVVINRTALVTTGNKLLQTADTDPTAWNVAAAILEYTSFLNKDVAPSTFGQQPYNVHFARSNSTIPDWEGKLGFIGYATAPNVANFDEINSPHLHDLDAKGPALIVLNGGTIDMDGMYIKNVVMLNAHVIYRGGPIHVDKVYFVNCTFDFDRQKQNSLMLASAVLDKPATVFSGE